MVSFCKPFSQCKASTRKHVCVGIFFFTASLLCFFAIGPVYMGTLSTPVTQFAGACSTSSRHILYRRHEAFPSLNAVLDLIVGRQCECRSKVVCSRCVISRLKQCTIDKQCLFKAHHGVPLSSNPFASHLFVKSVSIESATVVCLHCNHLSVAQAGSSNRSVPAVRDILYHNERHPFTQNHVLFSVHVLLYEQAAVAITHCNRKACAIPVQHVPSLHHTPTAPLWKVSQAALPTLPARVVAAICVVCCDATCLAPASSLLGNSPVYNNHLIQRTPCRLRSMRSRLRHVRCQ